MRSLLRRLRLRRRAASAPAPDWEDFIRRVKAWKGGTRWTDVPEVEPRPEATPFFRSGRGSLRGKLIVTDDWDSNEVKDEIAREFGLEP